MRKRIAFISSIVIAVIVLITYVYFSYFEPNVIKPYKFNLTQTRLLDTIGSDNVRIYNYCLSKEVNELRLSVSLYNNGVLIDEIISLPYLFNNGVGTKKGSIILDYSRDEWLVSIKYGTTRISNTALISDCEKTITDTKITGIEVGYNKKRTKISANEKVVLALYDYYEFREEMFSLMDCFKDYQKIDKLGWVVVTEVSVK